METPATGMWGPGEYGPGFVTIDQVRKRMLVDGYMSDAHLELWNRCAIREFALDLAEDLDARGLVLMSEAEIETQIHEAHSEGVLQGYSDGCEHY